MCSQGGKSAYGRKFSYSIAQLFFCLLLLGACAQLPNQANVKRFADATTSVTSTLNSSIDINADLAQRQGIEHAALVYLTQDTVPGQKYTLPPKPSAAISKKAIASQRALIAAIGKYAQALSSASDPATIQNLQTAATALSTTVGTAITLFVGPAAVPIITPAAQLVGRGIGLMVADTYGPEILAIMRDTQQPLAQAAQLLKVSMAAIVSQDENKLNLWRGTKIDVLTKVRTTPGINAAAVSEFRAAAKEAQDLQAKIDALKNYSALLDAMVAAHASLIAPSSSSDGDLTAFVDLVNQLTAIVSATKSTGQT